MKKNPVDDFIVLKLMGNPSIIISCVHIVKKKRKIANTCSQKKVNNAYVPIHWLFFKVEEERSKVASVLREKQELHEKWVEIERKLEKIQHEFSVKEAQNRAMQVMCLSHATTRWLFPWHL